MCYSLDDQAKAGATAATLGLLAGEVEQGADAVVVAVQLRAGMVEHEGEDELLHEAEDRQIFMAANLVEHALLAVAQKGDPVGAGEGFREEAAAEFELGAGEGRPRSARPPWPS